MNDLLLSLVVIAAVVAFGALISVGNERQRKAIDRLHQAYRQWAVQDLRIKRGVATTQIRIDDTAAWLTRITSLAFGRKTAVMDFQVHSSPVHALEFHDGEAGKTVVCVLETPETLAVLLKRRRAVIRGDLRPNPVFRVKKKTPVFELSMLNAGGLFDIELPIAWKILTNEVTDAETLWAYVLD
jgi:hypothetical protein